MSGVSFAVLVLAPAFVALAVAGLRSRRHRMRPKLAEHRALLVRDIWRLQNDPMPRRGDLRPVQRNAKRIAAAELRLAYIDAQIAARGGNAALDMEGMDHGVPFGWG